MTADLAMMPAWQLVKLFKARKASPVEAAKAAIAAASSEFTAWAANALHVTVTVDTSGVASGAASPIASATWARGIASV